MRPALLSVSTPRRDSPVSVSSPRPATTEGLAQLNSNDYLILASTFHSIHAIAARISPVPGSSGVESIEADTFKMSCLQTPTGEQTPLPGAASSANFPSLRAVVQSFAATLCRSSPPGGARRLEFAHSPSP